MQLKLVGEKALVTVDDPHIPRGDYTLCLVEILQRFCLQENSLLVIWRGRRARLRGCSGADRRGLGVGLSLERRKTGMAHEPHTQTNDPHTQEHG
jgi:hypothetical protein